MAEEHFTFKINVFKFFFIFYTSKKQTALDSTLSCHRAPNFTLSRFICRSSDLTALSYFAPPPRGIPSKDNNKKGCQSYNEIRMGIIKTLNYELMAPGKSTRIILSSVHLLAVESFVFFYFCIFFGTMDHNRGWTFYELPDANG